MPCAEQLKESFPLANVYLHFVFDLWAHAWRQKQAGGDVIIVRFADDIVVGFQTKSGCRTVLGRTDRENAKV
ncbi:MAG: hypothetical protein NVS1B11_20690 [Terriglobales bacterium]